MGNIGSEKAMEIQDIEKYVSLYNKGIDFTVDGNYDAAIDCWQKALKIKPDCFSSLASIGEVFVFKGNIAKEKMEYYYKAIEYLKKALVVKPSSYQVNSILGSVYIYVQDYDKALEYFLKALDISQKNEVCLDNIGLAYSYKKDYNKAVFYYEKELEINPNSTIAYYGLMQVYKATDQSRKLQECLDKAVALKLDNDKYYAILGKCFSLVGWFTDSIKSFQKAVAMNNENDVAKRCLQELQPYCFFMERDKSNKQQSPVT